MTDFTYRSLQETDYVQVGELFREFAAFEKLPEKMVNSVDRMMKEKEYFNGFVAETADGNIVGYATWFFAYFTWTGKSLYMDDLYVKPEYRGKGIGSSLIGMVRDFATQSGCHKLRWQVSSWNKPAIGFYRQLGAVIDHVEMNCDLPLD